jgi:hypothetical protein
MSEAIISQGNRRSLSPPSQKMRSCYCHVIRKHAMHSVVHARRSHVLRELRGVCLLWREMGKTLQRGITRVQAPKCGHHLFTRTLAPCLSLHVFYSVFEINRNSLFPTPVKPWPKRSYLFLAGYRWVQGFFRQEHSSVDNPQERSTALRIIMR